MPNKISVVLLSGGLDSCVAATMKAQEPGTQVHLLSMWYGQGGFAEMIQAEKIAEFLYDQYSNVKEHSQLFIGARTRLHKDKKIDIRQNRYEKLDMIDKDALRFQTHVEEADLRVISGYQEVKNMLAYLTNNDQALSSLTDIVVGSLVSMQGFVGWRSPQRGYAAYGLPNGYPSTRDEAFTLLAAGGVEARLIEYLKAEYGEVVLSTTRDDLCNFPDIALATYERDIGSILDRKELPQRFRKPITVKMPFVNLPKQTIVELGKNIGAPINLTWSCYFGEPGKPCYDCDQCDWRSEAFAKAGIEDSAYQKKE